MQNKKGIWDYGNMLHTLSDDQDFAKEITEKFIAQTKNIFLDMQNALQKKQCLELSRHAHKLKGSSAMLSIYGIEQAAKQLEESAKSEDIAECQKNYALCEETFDLFLAIAKALLG